MLVINSGAGSVIQGKDSTTAITVVENPFIRPGEGETITDGDIVYTDSVNGFTAPNFTIALDSPSPIEKRVIDNLTPSVVAINYSTGDVSRITDGIAKVYCEEGGKSPVVFKRDMTEIEDFATTTIDAYVDDTLAKHCYEQMVALVGATPYSIEAARYVTTSGTAPAFDNDLVYTRNPNSIVSGLDFSGIACRSHDLTTAAFGPALISPRHALTAEHVARAIGETYTFQRPDGTFQMVTLVGRKDYESDDLSLLYFDQDVTGCSIFKVMPQGGLETYSPSLVNPDRDGHIPVLRHSRFTAAGTKTDVDPNSDTHFQISFILALDNTTTTKLINGTTDTQIGDIATRFSDWRHYAGLGGDSGGPSFILVNGEPVLVGLQSVPTAAANVDVYTSEINADMNILASTAQGTYALQHPNLSAFTVL